MIGSFEVGGSQALVINYYKAIDRTKIQFDFIVDHPDRMALAEVVRSLGARIYKMPRFTGKNYFQIKKAWKKFFSEHPEYKILHSHVRSYASVYIPIAKKYGVKTIIHSHSTSNGKGVAAISKRILQFPLRYQADYLMACSNEAGQWLYGKKACLKDNYFFLPNAIDVEKYRYRKEISEEYRKQLGLENKFVIGHVGRFHEAKNHMFLLDVFAEVRKKRTDAVLLLVGDGDLRGQIEEKIRSLDLDEYVVLTGNRNDVPQLMQAMDVFVFPSKWEGLPVTVVEAQAAGLTCLVSDTVTRDVNTSVLVKYLPINKGINLWVDEILKPNLNKKDVIKDIRNAGFDIIESAKLLDDFYCMMIEEER
ncbi:MAG: glycosyltransferase family 1 protein [Ruminococcaceae bacterium]|nr:glycosyltransferase family 1 protein [Oscillospiraceae bacterium]